MRLLLAATDPDWKIIVDSAIELVRVIVWPAVALAALAFLNSDAGRRIVAGLTSRVHKVSAGRVSIELSDATATGLKADLEATFRDYREQVNTGFDRLNHVHRVGDLRDRVAREIIRPNVSSHKFRCTVYVPDILFADALYCLLDYYPKGAARGRAFSLRYGIIGKAWRLARSELQQDVPGDREHLVTEWGMTSTEAVEQQPQALLCFILIAHSIPVGLLFAEAEPHDFDENICDILEQSSSARQLAEAVAVVTQEMRRRGPALKVL